MTFLNFKLLSAGYCLANKAHALQGSTRETIRFYATFGLIIHPERGVILFDTGYTKRFHTYTQRWPFVLYGHFTKVFIEETETAEAQLKQLGIKASDVRYIIISHFHADHIAGLKDFPNAQFICNSIAYVNLKHKKGFAALKQGFIPDLLPPDFEKRLQPLSFDSATEHIPHLGRVIDLFGDKSIVLVELDGHAYGQIGALLNTEKQKTFLIADAAWLTENYEQLHFPHPIVKLFFSGWSVYKRSLNRVHAYALNNPKVLIIPCHCQKVLDEVMKENLHEPL